MPKSSSRNSDFTILNIVDRGDIKNERLSLKARRDLDAGSTHLIFDSTFGEDGNVSNHNRHLYILNLKEDVEKDDFVVIYTKDGKQNSNPSRTGTSTYHFYYWGLKSTVWNRDKNEIVHLVPLEHLATRKFAPEG